MFRYKLTLEYVGTPYSGWQKTDTGPSIQESLEDAVLRLCGEPVKVIAAGRTDAGVHAAGQVVHVDLPREYDAYTVMSALNFHLLGLEDGAEENVTRDIAILKAEAVPQEFHARFSATARHYEYRILNRRAPSALLAKRAWHVAEALDVEAMQQAANLLLGDQDFASFRDAKCQAKSSLKTLDYLRMHRTGDEIVVETGARSFLHHQVRIMVGTLRLCGNGKWSVGDMKAALEARNRASAGPTAPPDGLTLMRVDY